MKSSEVEIINKLGLHARAAAKLVTLCAGFSSEVQVGKPGKMVNGKSIMGIMMLAAGRGTTLTIRTEGSDENAAHDALRALIEDRFEEEE